MKKIKESFDGKVGDFLRKTGFKINLRDLNEDERDWVEGLEKERILVKEGDFLTVKNKTILNSLK